MIKKFLLVACLFSLNAYADEAVIRAVAPVFNNIISYNVPDSFKSAYETTNKDGYINEAIPKDQSLDNWKQMISLTGAKDFKSKDGASPKNVLNFMAAGFKDACPDSFSGINLNLDEIDGRKSAAGVISCGKLKKSGKDDYSETTLVLVIEGSKDYYTLQWAERAAPRGKITQDDLVGWSKKSALLSPIKVCDKVPGEQPPYPSCLNKK